MSGRGKGGKGLGKGGAKRHRKILRDNIQGITKPAIRRLARRGGVKRISGLIYEETRGVLKIFLENVIRDSVTYTEHAKRKTVTALDVVYALKRSGRILYGRLCLCAARDLRCEQSRIRWGENGDWVVFVGTSVSPSSCFSFDACILSGNRAKASFRYFSALRYSLRLVRLGSHSAHTPTLAPTVRRKLVPVGHPRSRDRGHRLFHSPTLIVLIVPPQVATNHHVGNTEHGFLQMCGGAYLPNETLHAIFEHLPPHSLASVVRASHRFQVVAERVLYTSISIVETLPRASPTAQYTAACASTILVRPHLAEVVRRLSIRWQTEPGLRDKYAMAAEPVLDILHHALKILIHLEHLDLALGLAGGTLDARAILDGCTFPSLRVFALSGVGRGTLSPKLYTVPAVPIGWFLALTPTIEQLHLLDCYETLELPAGALPRLATFRGSAIAAASVLPGRPVQLLGLVGHEFITERDLQRIAQASAPVRFLDLSMMSVTPILLRDISRHLHAVEVLKVKLALRHTLHFALSGIVSTRAVSLSSQRHRASLTAPPRSPQSLLAGLTPVLGAFPALEQLDLSPTHVDAIGRGNALEESSLCTTWARACPALRSIVFPSGTAWRREDGADVWVAAAGAATVWTRY
ncbi:hypothetical protein BD413DRAFT_492184 [Trametes elegans]|nr:hypothetical protein BD413DRAFT_492184 [Trametes elegans]